MRPVWLTDTLTPDLDRALHYTALWGLEGLELRTLGNASDRVPFVNEARLRRRLDEHEMPVAAIVPGLFEGPATDRLAWLNEVVALDETLSFCVRIGCPKVVVSGFSAAAEGADEDDALAVAALRQAGDRAARHGLVLAVLNEAKMRHQTGASLGALLEAVDHPSVQAAWHPAGALQAGEEAAVGYAALADRLTLVRCTDGQVAPDGTWTPVLLGEGAVGWPALLGQLAKGGYDGPLSLEVELDPRPRHGLRAASTLITLVRQAQKAAQG